MSQEDAQEEKEAAKPKQKFRLCYLELLTVLSGVFIFILGLSFWHFSRGPVNINFLKNTIIAQVNTSNDVFNLAFEDLYIEWVDLSTSPYIYAQNVQLEEKSQASKIDIPKVSAQVHIWEWLTGDYGVYSITIEEPHLKVIKTPSGYVSFNLKGSVDENGNIAPDKSTDTLEAFNFWQKLEEFQNALNKSGFEDLSEVHLKQAQLDVIKIGEDKNLIFDDVNLRLLKNQNNVNVLAKGLLKRQGVDADPITIEANAFILPKSQEIRTVLKLPDNGVSLSTIDALIAEDFKINLDAQASGKIIANFSSDLEIDTLNLELSVENLLPKNSESIVQKLGLETVFLDAGLDFKKEDYAAEVQLTLKDLGESVEAKLEVKQNQENKISVSVDMQLKSLKHDEIEALWPENIDHVAKKWMVTKMKNGLFEDIKTRFDVHGTLDEIALFQEKPKYQSYVWDMDFNSVTSNFTFKDLEMSYIDSLLPVTNGEGAVEVKGKKMSIDVASGRIGDMDILKGDLFFDDLVTKGAGNARVSMQVKGGMKSVFEFATPEPINLLDKFQADTENASGEALLDVVVKFPTVRGLKAEEVDVDVTATLTDISIPQIFNGMTLTGGPYTLRAQKSYFNLAGAGELSELPVVLEWERYFDSAINPPFKTKAKVNALANNQALKNFDIDLSPYIKGDFKADVIFKELRDTKSEIAVHFDFASTPISIEALGYQKDPNLPLSMRADIHLKGSNLSIIDNIRLNGHDADVQGAALFYNSNGRFAHGEIGKFKLAENDLKLKFQRGDKGQLKTKIEGPFLDGRAFLKTSDVKTDLPALEVSADVESVRTDDDRIIQRVKTYFRTNNKGRIEEMGFDSVAGSGPLNIRYIPDEKGDLHFKMRAEDAGATLSAFGIFDNIVGGKLDVDGTPKKEGVRGDLKGRAIMSDFAVEKAPAMAQVLNALSLSGLVSSFQNKGIEFSKLSTDFDYQQMPQGKVMTLRDGRTSGSALGVSFGGVINQDTKTIDLKGTIVPATGVNKLVSKIPVIGEALSGGEDAGLFAATYTIKGPIEAPKVDVNALSALAPGFLRKLFFEGPAPVAADTAIQPQVEVKSEQEKSDLVEPKLELNEAKEITAPTQMQPVLEDQ